MNNDLPSFSVGFIADIYSGHITANDAMYLAEQSDLYADETGTHPIEILVLRNSCYGYIFPMPNLEEITTTNISLQFRRILIAAEQQEIKWILIDIGGTKYEELEIYDW